MAPHRHATLATLTPTLPRIRRSLSSFSNAQSSQSDRDAHDFFQQWKKSSSYDPANLRATTTEDQQRIRQTLREGRPPHELEKYSPSYFTGKPLLHDTMYQLDRLLKLHQESVLTVQQDPQLQLQAQKTRPEWVPRAVLEEAWNFRVSPDDYRELLRKLATLHSIATVSKDQAVQSMVAEFTKPGTEQRQNQSGRTLDALGRAYAVGHRRRVKAHVWVVEAKQEGTGRVLIDGVDMTDRIERLRDRARIAAPFEVTDSLGKYNVWCEIETSVDGMKCGDTGECPPSPALDRRISSFK